MARPGRPGAAVAVVAGDRGPASTRAELAAALGTSVAHAGVRVQRMRNQLELSRSLVAALEASPGAHS